MSQPWPDPLAAVIARTEGAIAAAAQGEAWPWRFARCWMLVDLVENHGGTKADMDSAIVEFHLLPVDVPSRAKLAATLVVGQMRRAMLNEYGPLRQAIALADIANADPAPLADWPKTDAVLRSMFLMHRMMRGTEELSPEQGLAEIERHAMVVGDDEPYRTVVEVARTHALYLRAVRRHDFASMHEALTVAGDLRHTPTSDRLAGAPLDFAAEVRRVMLSVQRGALPDAQAGLERLTALLDGYPPDSPLRAGAGSMVASLRAGLDLMRAGIGQGARAGARVDTWGLPGAPDADLPVDTREFYERAVRQPGPTAEMSSHQGALGLALLLGDDDASVDLAIDRLRSAVATAPPRDPHRPTHLLSLGLALGIRFEDRRAPADLTEAITVLVEARSLAATPAHPQWADCSKLLGNLYRQAGRGAEGSAIALDGMRGHAYGVLLQSDIVGRTNASRDAAEDAIDIARWFLGDGDAAGAATALDAGRGLTLFAATEHRSVADRLVALGQAELAERWRSATHDAHPTSVPIELRQAVLDARSDWLAPPEPAQIQAALRTLRFDAIVYLIPGDGGSGAAVIVPAQGAARQVFLPLLHRSHMPDLNRVEFLAGPRRDARAQGVVSLDDVCEWAWAAVVGPVLKRVPGQAGRLPRIALVPMRELAVVPWHAARTVEHGRVVRAVERAVFSYALSARLLCANAAAAPVPLDDLGLFVGDPDTAGRAADLPAARAEAWAVRERYYPAASYVGRTPAGSVAPGGPGRATDIVHWLADARGGSVLHLACHAVVDPVPAVDDADPGRVTDTAYLMLSAGERLAAERIAATRPVGLVVLAACNSGVAARGGHDEAFSLAATFLTAGARTVVSSLWSVPDGATSVLMFMFHHYLRGGLPPVDALRRAQVWMTDADRRPPPEMPEHLRLHLAGADASNVDGWAGFFHMGR